LRNFRDSEAIQEYNVILYSYVALIIIKGPQQQLISLQQWSLKWAVPPPWESEKL